MRLWNKPRLRSAGLGYGIAVGATGVIGFLRLAAEPWLKGQGSLTPFILAVIAASWVGGLVPGLVATLLGLAAGSLLFPPFDQALGIELSARLALLTTFGVAGVLISWGSEALRRAQDRLEKQTEQLRARVEEAEQLLEILPVAVWIAHDPECKSVTGNAFAERLLRLPPGTNMSADSPQGKKWLASRGRRKVTPSELPLRRAIAQASPVAGSEFEVTIEGVTTVFLGNAAPLFDAEGKVRGAVAACLDITEREDLDQALRESEERYRLATEALSGLVYQWDAATDRVERSEGLHAITGFRPQEAEPSRDWWEQRIEPDDLARLQREFHKMLPLRPPIQEARYRVRHRDGSYRTVWDRCRLLYDENGGLHRVVGCSLDITALEQAEEALRTSEERMRLAIEATGLGVFDVDTVSGAISWSEAAKRIFALPPEARMTPEIVLERIHPDDRNLVIWATARSYDPVTGGEFEVEHRIVRPDGKVCWVSAKGKATFEERPDGPHVSRHTGVMLDVTPRKEAELELERSRRLFQRIAEATPDLLYLFDVINLRNLFVNEAASRILGYSPERIQALGSDLIAALVHPDDIVGVMEGHQRFDTMAEGEVYEHDLRMRHSNGSYRWLRCRDLVFEQAPDGRAATILGIAHDITDQRTTEAALLASEEQSRQRAEQLAEADRRKDQFLALLAHELRNPLAPIRNGLQILRIAAEDVQAVQRITELMGRQVDQMVRLIDDLLDVSRISRGKLVLRRERLNLQDLATHVVEAVRPLFEAAGQELEVSLAGEEIYVEADSARLAQILTNLLNNASKFTERGGRVRLSVSEEDGQALVRVRDTGVGIAPEMLPRIFEMFVQADSSLARSQGGLGIGLTLVKNLAEMHGGSVEAYSEGLGKGSEFSLWLPLAGLPADVEPAPAKRTDSESRPLRILVVDDHQDTAETLCLILEMKGHGVRCAISGPEALRIAESFHPEVVFCDVGMPEMSGFEVARRLREGQGQALFLVALTGYGTEDDRRSSLAAGFDRHLVKPVQPAELFDLLASLETPA